MEPRIYPFWEPKPLQELDVGLRHAVEAVREEPVPGSALERALERAGRIPEKTRVRQPWLRRRMLIAVTTVAASLLLALGLWAVLSSIPVGDGTSPVRRTGVAIGITKGTTDEERELANVRASIDDPGIDIDVERIAPMSKGRSGTTRETIIRHGCGEPAIMPRPGNQPARPVVECCPYFEGAAQFVDNRFQHVTQSPVSTVAVTVDTVSYSDVRRFLLQEKKLPPREAVRVAELINSFPYKYEEPREAHPVAFTLNLVECPWNRQHHLLRIALKARELDPAQGTSLAPIASDVKLQVEFDPQRVGAYRLIGCEKNLLKTEDSNEARQGDNIGPGHTVTALYEIIPTGLPIPTAQAEPLKSTKAGQRTEDAKGGEWLTVKLRYKDHGTDSTKLLAQSLAGDVVKLLHAPEDVQFAAAVAGFGMLLRKTEHCDTSFSQVRQLAEKAVGQDVDGQRAEFLKLLDAAETLTKQQVGQKDARTE